MKASPRQQQLLLQLQNFDTELARLKRRLANLPEAEQLRELQTHDATLRDQFMTAQRTVEELATEIARIEDDTRVVQQRFERTSERLAASVSGKEAQALQEEMQMLAQRRSTLEDRELELMESHESATAAFDRATADIAEHDARKRDVEELINEATSDINAQLTELTEERAGLAAEIQGNVREIYERTRERYGIGAARLHGRVSEGSNLELDAADYAAAMATPDDELYFCPVSGAILVRGDAADDGA